MAVDQQGKRSGPSDYATAPRPIIFSKPALAAKVGAEYRYQVQSNRSLGDLRIDGKLTANFYDIEKPKFAIEQGPKWLKVDPATGRAFGHARCGRQGRSRGYAPPSTAKFANTTPGRSRWGSEKITEVATENLGTATQPFVIEVSP